MSDLSRIANAVEHIAYPQVVHDLKSCAICRQKKRPIKRMPGSVVLNSERLKKRELELRQQHLMAGPEEPVADMFRYRELKP
jgi:hypothetical protein